MANTTTEIGRLKLLHPDFRYDGGLALHTLVRNAWLKLSDVINSRFFTVDGLINGGTANFEHNFKTAFSDLRIDLYLRNTGTGELTRVVPGGTPDLSTFTITATPGSLTTQIRVINNSGATRDIALVVVHGKGVANINDLEDVDTTGLVDKNALVYNSSLNKWVPGIAGQLTYDYIVDAAGRGDYTTIQAAVSAVPANKTIYVRNGSYDLLGSLCSLKIGMQLIGESKDGVLVTSNNTMFTTLQKTFTRQLTRLTANKDNYDTVNGVGTVSVTTNNAVVTYTGDLAGGTVAANDRISIGNSPLLKIIAVDTGAKTFTLENPYQGQSRTGIPVYINQGGLTTDYESAPVALKNMTLFYNNTGGAACNFDNSYRGILENIVCYHANTGSANQGFIRLSFAFQTILKNCKTISTSPSGGASFTLNSAWGVIFDNHECFYSLFNYWAASATNPSMYCDIHFKRIHGSYGLFFLGFGGLVNTTFIVDNLDISGGFIQDGGGTAEDWYKAYIEIKNARNCAGQMTFYGKEMIFVGGMIENESRFRFKSRQGSTNNVLQSGSFLTTPASNLEVDGSTILCSGVIYPTGALSGVPKHNSAFAF